MIIWGVVNVIVVVVVVCVHACVRACVRARARVCVEEGKSTTNSTAHMHTPGSEIELGSHWWKVIAGHK